MFEKVNPAHPDKIADRIAGALVDLAYKSERNPRIAVEVLIGHGTCHIIAETSVQLSIDDVTAAVHRIAGFLNVDYSEVPQDVHLSRNQSGAIRCGDNGIFKGVPVTAEQKELVSVATDIYNAYPFDGKYIIDNGRVIICQSNAKADHLREIYPAAEINPLGDWTGGTDVDTGATNRKLGSDKPENRTAGSAYAFYMGGTTAGKTVTERSAMQMTAVYSCVRILAEAVAGLPLHLYKYTDGGGKEKALDHPLYRLLHDEPNPEMSSFVFRETLMTHLLLWGNAYAQVIRNGKGEVIALYPLMPNKMSVDRDENGRLYYTYYRGSDEAIKNKDFAVTLQPSDVLHIPGLGFDGLVGYSPIAMAKNAIGMAIACEEYGAKFFANGAAPGGVLEHPGTIKDPQRVRESWQSTFGGSGNANKIAVLEEGMKYTPIGISPEQAQFLETRKFQINEIARIFRVPPHMVGDLEKSSFSNIEQQSLEFVKYTLDPWVIRWEQSIQRALLSQGEKAEYFVKFNLEGLLRGDYQSRMNGYAIGRQNGWMSANDIRELENLDRIPAEEGGDLYLINGNMLPLKNAGAFANTPTDDGKEENPDEEVLEVEEPGTDGDGSGGEDSVSQRHHRRGKLV